MAQTQGYQPNWFGAMQNTPQPQVQQPNQNGQQNLFPPMMNNNQMNESYLFIAPVQSEEAVNNYPVARGVTAILINYSQGVFWKKRQTNDGLGYETVKHFFFTEEEFERLKVKNVQRENSTNEIDSLKADLAKLRKEFEDFIK